jgi:glutamate synthase (NADPH/NADH) small chain
MPTPRQEHDASVGIIGAGPAGLSAAEALRRQGIQVHIYDRYDRAGGLMMYGIPNFKLDKHVVQRRSDLLAQAKVKFHYNINVDTIVFNDIKQKHQAVLIATGVYKARDIQLIGRGLGGVIPAMAYLTASNRKGLGDSVEAFDEGELNAAGKDVVVIGGGDTAMDCVRTAVRQGAASVTCLYRRDKANMPGSKREVHHAEEEGVRFEYLAAPQAFLGDQHIEAVRAQRLHLGQPDASGRQQPLAMEGESFALPATMVILALGYEAEPLPSLFGVPELAVTQWGTVKIDATGQTSLPRVYAAGDIVRGASLVVWAIKDGRDVATHIAKAVLA